MATEKMIHSVSRCLFVFTLFVVFGYSLETDNEYLEKKALRSASRRLNSKHGSRTFVINSEYFKSENGLMQEFDPARSLAGEGKLRSKRDTTPAKTNSPTSVSVSCV